jgi:hypothetical protein
MTPELHSVSGYKFTQNSGAFLSARNEKEINKTILLTIASKIKIPQLNLTNKLT